ncbi:MAG TPA: hypothetical protein VFF69_04370 [Phycisphaerales bacterium]|nr:hypothetical protein [Phycisphaerales bacterium]
MRGTSGLVERFLGAEAAAGGVHALLGLADGEGSEGIIAALDRRLTTLDRHPQGRTPEADEVRLALHAAAAQLLDRSARSGAGPALSGGARARQSPQAFRRQLEQDAIVTLARYGGWNRRSLRRLSMLAIARGGKPGDVAGVLTHLARRRQSGGAEALVRGRRARSARVARPPLAEPRLAVLSAPQPEEGAKEIDNKPLIMLIGAGATLLALVVAVALVVVAISGGDRPAPPEQAETAGQEAPRPTPEGLPMAGGEEIFPWQGERPGEPRAGAEAPEPAPAFESLADALATLNTAAEGLSVDPARAAAVFSEAFGAVGERWCNLTTGQLRAAQHDVVEFVYRAVQRPELSEQIIAAVGAGGEVLNRGEAPIRPDEVWPAAWSVGMLSRLSREQDLGAVAARSVEDRLRRQVGSPVAVSGGFEQGAQAALWAMLPAMVREPGAESADEAWECWIEAARAGQEGAQAAVLGALEWVVLSGAEPTESEPVRRAIDALALACDWGEGSAARAWVIRMFADARVSNADLHAITTALARRSRAPGVDATMALPVRSSAEQRDLLRERYAGAWALEIEGPTLDDLATDWAGAVAEASARAEAGQSSVERLAAAACLSRLCEAAALRHSGRLDDAGVVIDEFDRLVELELTTWTQRQSADRVPDEEGMTGTWAFEYLSAQRDFAERVRLLNDAAKRAVRHPVDAEVLVREAVRGSPAQARAAARDALMAQKPAAALTLAMLEVAPKIPRTRQNAELVSALTATPTISIDDPDWRLRIRRVLVQSALEQLAAEGDHGIIDRLAALLGESYAARAVGEASGTGSSAVPQAPPEQAASMLRVRWERLARQGGLGSGAISVEAIHARHASRLGLAQGPVQTFAAEQLAAFELMAVAVASERIDKAADVLAVEAALREARRKAPDIVAQVLEVDRAFVRLWAIRLGQEIP